MVVRVEERNCFDYVIVYTCDGGLHPRIKGTKLLFIVIKAIIISKNEK